MKILYALQATGNGHISRANEILPRLEKMCEVDVLLSGTQADVGLNHIIKYRLKGLSFIFGKKGGIDFLKTFKQMETKRFLKEMKSIPVEEYDFVINDFEPLSAWACKSKNILCISLSHQYAVISKASPKPKKYDPMAWMVLRYYAPCSIGIGFHFKEYDAATFTPVIRADIRNAYLRNMGHYTVYLPAYSDEKIIKVLGKHTNVQWHIFSKHSTTTYSKDNCWIRPINNNDFISSVCTSEAVLCGAGFETPAETLFMNKKLLVIPMKSQYEQHCNAAALKQMGVTVLKKLSIKNNDKVAEWIKSEKKIHVDYPDNTSIALEHIFKTVAAARQQKLAVVQNEISGISNTVIKISAAN